MNTTLNPRICLTLLDILKGSVSQQYIPSGSWVLTQQHLCFRVLQCGMLGLQQWSLGDWFPRREAGTHIKRHANHSGQFLNYGNIWRYEGHGALTIQKSIHLAIWLWSSVWSTEGKVYPAGFPSKCPGDQGSGVGENKFKSVRIQRKG